jgi:hypothetical protein
MQQPDMPADDEAHEAEKFAELEEAVACKCGTVLESALNMDTGMCDPCLLAYATRDKH